MQLRLQKLRLPSHLQQVRCHDIVLLRAMKSII